MSRKDRQRPRVLAGIVQARAHLALGQSDGDGLQRLGDVSLWLLGLLSGGEGVGIGKGHPLTDQVIGLGGIRPIGLGDPGVVQRVMPLRSSS
ncbi:MAG: hypothetical protein H7338_11755 [Candidatus Sericytochromatia bacterium]|nr:hypothetical protein [Candidatus Sericytochromatia bacterium]